MATRVGVTVYVRRSADDVVMAHGAATPDGDDWHPHEHNAAEWAQNFSSWLESPLLRRWFASNCHWNTPAMPAKLACIPIGLPNRYNQENYNYQTRENSWTTASVSGAAASGHLVLVDFEESKMKPHRKVALVALAAVRNIGRLLPLIVLSAPPAPIDETGDSAGERRARPHHTRVQSLRTTVVAAGEGAPFCALPSRPRAGLPPHMAGAPAG
eukprot:COSAG01_NODE_1791_length_9221_cov_7.677373_4_plen_213_part_00